MTTTKRGFTTVGILLAMVMIAANVTSALYGVYAKHFSFGPATLTATFATYVVFLIPSLLFWGQWSDHYGRNYALRIGLLFAILGTLSFMFAQGVIWLFVARALQGLGAGILSGPATAMLAELDLTQKKAPLVATLATGGGTAIGPLLGGTIAQYGPYRLHLVYIVSLVGLIGIAIALFRIRETRSRPDSSFHWSRPKVPRQIRGIFWLAGGTAFIVWSVAAFFMSLAPSYVETLLHLTNLAIAGGIVFLMLATASVTQLVTRNFNPHKIMPIGLILTSVAVLGLIFSVPQQSLILLIISTLLAGIGQGIAFLGSMKAITKAAPTDAKAGVVSSFYVLIYIGVGVPVVALGLLAQRLGLYNAMMYYAVFVVIVTIGLVGGLLRNQSSRSSPITEAKKVL